MKKQSRNNTANKLKHSMPIFAALDLGRFQVHKKSLPEVGSHKKNNLERGGKQMEMNCLGVGALKKRTLRELSQNFSSRNGLTFMATGPMTGIDMTVHVQGGPSSVIIQNTTFRNVDNHLSMHTQTY